MYSINHWSIQVFNYLYFFCLFQVCCPWLKDFVIKRSPVLDNRLDPKHNPKVHHPGGNTSDGSGDEDDGLEATFELSEEVTELLNPCDNPSAAKISDSHLNTSANSHEAMDVSEITNQLNTSLHIGNQSAAQTNVNDVTDTDHPMQLAVTSTPLRPSSMANPVDPPPTVVTNFNLSKMSDFGSLDFNVSSKSAVDSSSTTTNTTKSPVKKRQKTSKGSFKSNLSIPIGQSGRCAEPRRSNRSNTSSLNLHLSSDSDSTTFEPPKSPLSVLNVSSLPIANQSVPSASTSALTRPSPPTPALTRSKSRAKVMTSSKPKPSNPSPPIIVIPSDGEIQKNIGWKVSFSREEKQLIYDLNFSLKKMWNLKNLCWMNASLIGLLYTFKENNTMLEEAPPELPRRNWSFKDYLAELQHMQDNTTFDCRLMIKKILLEFSNANVGWEAGNDFVDNRLLEQQQQIETLFQIFGPNTQYDCPWDSLRPKIEWSVDTEVCPNQRCSRKAIGKTAKTRTDALITISSIPDGTDFSDKVSHDFGSVDPDSECAQYTCECGQGCKDEQLQNCPRLYICKETIRREMKGRVVDAKQGVIFSLPRIKYGANFTWVMIKLLLKSD